MNKKKIKQFLLGQLDNLEHINAVIGEKKKFRDKRRVEICNSTKLSQEQIDSVEKLYKNNYGKKIPLTWHKSYTAYTGRFDKYYFPEILYIPEFERYMNYNQSLANVLEDKNLLYVFAKASNVRMPRMYLSCQAGIYKDAENKVLDFEKACALISNIGVCFAKPSIGTDSGRGCEVYCLVNGTDTKSGKTSDMLLKDLGKNFTIQERLVCHESIRKIYDGSVNTFRIMTYRWKNQIIVAPIIMRIGRGGSYLDNAHAGGMFIALSDDVINNKPNGLNINNNAGSTHIEGLQKFVVENGLDVGFAYDGDADRCLCVDEKGNVITGDHILYMQDSGY